MVLELYVLLPGGAALSAIFEGDEDARRWSVCFALDALQMEWDGCHKLMMVVAVINLASRLCCLSLARRMSRESDRLLSSFTLFRNVSNVCSSQRYCQLWQL